jgi:hypothetical protein
MGRLFMGRSAEPRPEELWTASWRRQRVTSNKIEPPKKNRKKLKARRDGGWAARHEETLGQSTTSWRTARSAADGAAAAPARARGRSTSPAVRAPACCQGRLVPPPQPDSSWVQPSGSTPPHPVAGVPAAPPIRASTGPRSRRGTPTAAKP